MMRAQIRMAIVVCASLLAACGGGGSPGSLPVVTPTGSQGGNGTLSIKISIPVPATGSSQRHFIVSQTNGIEVALTPQGASQPTIDIAFDVSPTSSLCTTSGGARTCTLAIPALGGTTYAVRFTSFDTAPVNGAIPPSAKQLAVGTTTTTIAAGQLNVLSVTLAGTPSSIVVPFSARVVLAGTAASVSLATTAVHDAAGNTIVGAYDAPIAVAVTDTGAHVTLSIDGGTTKSASVNLASSTDASNLTAYYDGGGSAGYVATMTFSASGVTSATSTLSRFGIAGTATFGTPTFAVGSPFHAAFAAPAQQLQLTASEANFSGSFSVKSSTCGGIAAVGSTPPTFALTSSTFGTCVVTITDGTLDAVVNVTANVTQSGGTVPPPTGSVTEYIDTIPNLLPRAITTGSDGNMWFVGQNAIDGYISRITPAGAITDFLLPGNDPYAIASGPDGNLWVLDSTSNNVTVVNTSGVVVTTYAVGTSPFGIALGSDSAMWVTNAADGTVSCITTGGATHTYTIPNSSEATGIAAGPDGAMWSVDFLAPSVVRIATPCGGAGGGSMTQYPIPFASGNVGIVDGPDNALWFTQTIASTVGRISTAGVYSNLGALPHEPDIAIVKGPDLNLWYSACSCTGSLERVTPAGVVTPFSSGISADIEAVSVGADGGIWYVGEDGGATETIIGRLQP